VCGAMGSVHESFYSFSHPWLAFSKVFSMTYLTELLCLFAIVIIIIISVIFFLFYIKEHTLQPWRLRALL
jgi:hypothetical protein